MPTQRTSQQPAAQSQPILTTTWSIAERRSAFHLVSFTILYILIVLYGMSQDWPLPSPTFFVLWLLWFSLLVTATDPLVKVFPAQKIASKMRQHSGPDAIISAVVVDRRIGKSDTWGWLILYPDRLEFVNDHEKSELSTVVPLDSHFKLRPLFMNSDSVKLILPHLESAGDRSYNLIIPNKRRLLDAITQAQLTVQQGRQ